MKTSLQPEAAAAESTLDLHVQQVCEHLRRVARARVRALIELARHALGIVYAPQGGLNLFDFV